MSGFLNKAVAGQISSWKQIFLPTVSISWKGLSYVLLISPATFRVERNSSFLRVPRRVFFPSLLMFCHTNASTVRQLPVAPAVCQSAPHSCCRLRACLLLLPVPEKALLSEDAQCCFQRRSNFLLLPEVCVYLTAGRTAILRHFVSQTYCS